MKITILGSGTGIISLARSSSAYWLETTAGSFLVDCGPGTLRQLLQAGGDPLTLDGVFLTHTHVDHVGDLLTLIHALRLPGLGRQTPLRLYGPADFVEIFQERFVPLCGTPDTFPFTVQVAPAAWTLGELSMTTAPVIHSPRMDSIAYRFQEGDQSVVFGGDCDWCPGILSLGQGANLMVLDCSCLESNKVVGHLAAGECGRIARQCQTGGVVLSHFYPIPLPDEARRQECGRYYDGPIHLAQDLMVLVWSDNANTFVPEEPPTASWSQVQGMARGFWQSRVLLASHNLGLFAAVGEGSVTADQLAQRLGLSQRGVPIILDALTALGLLVKRGEHYRNTAMGLDHLRADGASPMTAALGHTAHMEKSWMGLEESVTHGHSVRLVEEGVVGDPARNRVFIGAMAEMGRPWARQIAQLVDFSPYHTLLDLGGGPGVYAMEILARYPQLRGVLADLPITLESAAPWVASSGYGHRLTLRPVDFFEDSQADLGQGYDAVLISNVLHVEGTAANQRLLAKVYESMLPGGMLVIHESIINPNRTTPLDRALFAVNMLVHTQRGNCYTYDEMAGWLQDAGFVGTFLETRMEPPSLIIAYKANPASILPGR